MSAAPRELLNPAAPALQRRAGLPLRRLFGGAGGVFPPLEQTSDNCSPLAKEKPSHVLRGKGSSVNTKQLQLLPGESSRVNRDTRQPHPRTLTHSHSHSRTQQAAIASSLWDGSEERELNDTRCRERGVGGQVRGQAAAAHTGDERKRHLHGGPAHSDPATGRRTPLPPPPLSRGPRTASAQTGTAPSGPGAGPAPPRR